MSHTHDITKALLHTNTGEVTTDDRHLAVMHRKEQLDTSTYDGEKLYINVKHAIESDSYASKLLDLSLFSKLCRHAKPKSFSSICISEDVRLLLVYIIAVESSCVLVGHGG